MAENNELYNGHSHDDGGMPLKNVIGFALSIILTAFSLWAACYTDYSSKTLLLVISGLAFVQAVLQLFYVQARH